MIFFTVKIYPDLKLYAVYSIKLMLVPQLGRSHFLTLGVGIVECDLALVRYLLMDSNCSTRNIIYAIKCQGSNEDYTGQTNTRLTY